MASDRTPLAELEQDARGLAARLPELMADARRLAQTVVHGIHGRRRAGPGDTFWQFRHYSTNDPRGQIDWRRSAGSDHLFVREREWEAAHTVWLWADLSPSMRFRSAAVLVSKRDRALVLTLALGELLAEGGERVGFLDVLPPTASRRVVERLAVALVARDRAAGDADSLPPPVRIGELSDVILVSDFLEPAEVIAARLRSLANRGVGGHLVEVLDPAEETLPYHGRAEIIGLEGDESMIAERVEGLRAAYTTRLAAHRQAIADVARSLGWSILRHRTDRPAAEALFGLHARVSGRAGADAAMTPRRSEPMETQP